MIWNLSTPTHYEVIYEKRCAVRGPLEQAFIEKLRSGELVAIGLEVPVGASSRREMIAPELWEVIEPDFENSGASGGGGGPASGGFEGLEPSGDFGLGVLSGTAASSWNRPPAIPRGTSRCWCGFRTAARSC